MHNIKYRGKKRLAYDMGYHFANLLPEVFLESFDIAIPIPLYWTRKLSRGYNQAEYFGRGILDGAGSRVSLHADIVKRVRSTGTQTKLDKTSRKQNMSDAFKIVTTELLKGKHVLLFDDVVTTGATVNACSRALLAHGCASVKVCALARD
jgi:ComF family protein